MYSLVYSFICSKCVKMDLRFLTCILCKTHNKTKVGTVFFSMVWYEFISFIPSNNIQVVRPVMTIRFFPFQEVRSIWPWLFWSPRDHDFMCSFFFEKFLRTWILLHIFAKHLKLTDDAVKQLQKICVTFYISELYGCFSGEWSFFRER